MKFLYEYRTSDNVPHDGVINAPNREAAYAALKAQGIRPGCVKEAPGFFNKLFGKGKRWMVIGVLCAVCGVLSFVFFIPPSALPENSALRTLHSALLTHSALFTHSALQTDRHQIYGDAAIIAAGIKTEWRDILDNAGDRLLAKFAQPGVIVPRLWTQKGIADELLTTFESKMQDSPDDLTEYRQIKAIVTGLRQELRQYLDEGGSALGFLERLEERQNLEAALYRRLEAEVKSAETNTNSALRTSHSALYSLWTAKNEELRALGIRTIPLPQELSED